MHTSDRVKQFITKQNLQFATSPLMADKDVRQIMMQSITEQLCELASAMGVRLAVQTVERNQYTIVVLAESENDRVDINDVARALGKLDFAVQSVVVGFGLPGDAIGAEILASCVEDRAPNIAEVLAWNYDLEAMPANVDDKVDLLMYTGYVLEDVFANQTIPEGKIVRVKRIGVKAWRPIG